MSERVSQIVSGIFILLILGGVIYLSVNRKPNSGGGNQTATTTNLGDQTPTTGVQYKNTQYGFIFSLPDSWKDYSIIEDEWEGDSIGSTGQVQTATITGPLISIRHPDWDYKSPRQDIPIMVFTIAEWNLMQADKFHIGAAPINPSEIGRNTKYVFAIPARYNFSYLTGYEEVDQIIRGDNFKTF